MRDPGITYAKPLLWDAPLRVRWSARVHVAWIRWRCAIKGCEWREERPTRCVTVTACQNCGRFIGSRVDRSDPESACLWYRPSMRAYRPEASDLDTRNPPP